MKCIWYNPDTDVYEMGAYDTFLTKTAISENGDRYDVLYEFPENSEALMDKILNSLNLVRQQTALAAN